MFITARVNCAVAFTINSQKNVTCEGCKENNRTEHKCSIRKKTCQREPHLHANHQSKKFDSMFAKQWGLFAIFQNKET